jgi:hypothetical protein
MATEEETKQQPPETSTFETPDEIVPDKQKVKRLRVVASKKSIDEKPKEASPAFEEVSKKTVKSVMKLQQAIDI